MIYNILIDNDSRIKGFCVGCSFKPGDGETSIEYELPGDFQVERANEYRMIDGELVHDPLPEPEASDIISTEQRLDEIETALCELAEIVAGGGM